MMLRDHFGKCGAMPEQTKAKFASLKEKPSQSATDSKRFWVYSAMKAGMADSAEGIVVNDTTRATGANAPPFGCSPGESSTEELSQVALLVVPADRKLVSEFLYNLLSQAQVVHLAEAERIGNRRSLRPGLPGFACLYCCQRRRQGLCRMFPARRRTLPFKVQDLYEHLLRCSLCPANVKEELVQNRHHLLTGARADQGGERELYDRVWSRLGHGAGSL